MSDEVFERQFYSEEIHTSCDQKQRTLHLRPARQFADGQFVQGLNVQKLSL
jgi:hypothetical protein